MASARINLGDQIRQTLEEEIHSGKLDNETVPVASSASMVNRSPSVIFPFKGRRSGGSTSSSLVMVRPAFLTISASNSTEAGVPAGFSPK